MLRKYVSDPSHVLDAPPVKIREDLSFEVQLVGIMDQREKFLRKEVVAMVTVLWKNNRVEKMTWETKAETLSVFVPRLSN